MEPSCCLRENQKTTDYEMNNKSAHMPDSD